MRLLFTFLLLVSVHTLWAQVDYPDDLNYPNRSDYLEMVDRIPHNSAFEFYRRMEGRSGHANTIELIHIGHGVNYDNDSLTAAQLLLQIDPYFFLAKFSSANEAYNYLKSKPLLNTDTLNQYKQLLSKAYDEKKSEAYNKFKQMADDLKKMHDLLENCKDSSCYVRQKNAMKPKEDAYFTILYRYLRKNEWPTLKDGSIYANKVSTYDWLHHEAYIPVLKKAMLECKVDCDYYCRTYYWQTISMQSFKYFGEFRYYNRYFSWDVTDLVNNKIPTTINDISTKISQHCPAWWLYVAEFKNQKLMDTWNQKLSDDINSNQLAYNKMNKALAEHKCNPLPYADLPGYPHQVKNANIRPDIKLTLYVVYEKPDTIISKFNKIIKDKKIILHKIHFDAGKADIMNGEISFLQNLVYWLKQNPLVRLNVDGHSDTEGNPEANFTLSEQRAENIKKYLLDNGIDEDRLITKGYGYMKPLFPNSNEKQKALNRRVELTIIQDYKIPESKLNKPLVAILDTIFKNDQDGRNQLPEIEKKYGYNSKEVKEQWKLINKNDSIDLIKIEKILDKYGWLGVDEIGSQGNSTLFLVIQHSDIKVQEKYLPMMRVAVKDNRANSAQLALLEDRVALRQGKLQIYGSQIGQDKDGHLWVSPLEDPDNVDKRRAKMGLPPIAEYLKQWDLKWDVEEYKKQLPEIIKKQKG